MTTASGDREARLRATAARLVRAAIAAVDPGPLVERALAERPLPDGPVHLVALGKAAGTMAEAARAVLGHRLAGGVVLGPPGLRVADPGPLDVRVGGHPVPDAGGMAAAQAIRDLVASLGASDVLLCLVSGGGSALMSLPGGELTLDDLQRTTNALLRAGAEIGEINAVRKHLEQLKGGRLALLAAPARVRCLVLSDVIGDPLETIASGPLSPDSTTFADALGVLSRPDLEDRVPAHVIGHLRSGAAGEIGETPGDGDPCFQRVEVEIVGNNRRAVRGLRDAAEKEGFATSCLTTSLAGEAREVGRVLGSIAREVRATGDPLAPPACIVAAGETTVTVIGSGRGGRNQEVALGALGELDDLPGVLVASFGTDGIDGPTDAAGALALGSSRGRARSTGLDVDRALADNDADPFFTALDDRIMTGPTGTNVMDLAFVLVDGGPGSDGEGDVGPCA